VKEPPAPNRERDREYNIDHVVLFGRERRKCNCGRPNKEEWKKLSSFLQEHERRKITAAHM
jgi:hypothetical protein